MSGRLARHLGGRRPIRDDHAPGSPRSLSCVLSKETGGRATISSGHHLLGVPGASLAGGCLGVVGAGGEGAGRGTGGTSSAGHGGGGAGRAAATDAPTLPGVSHPLAHLLCINYPHAVHTCVGRSAQARLQQSVVGSHE